MSRHGSSMLLTELRDCDTMRFYPHNGKHRDRRHRSGGLDATAIPAGDGAAPMRQGTADVE